MAKQNDNNKDKSYKLSQNIESLSIVVEGMRKIILHDPDISSNTKGKFLLLLMEFRVHMRRLEEEEKEKSGILHWIYGLLTKK